MHCLFLFCIDILEGANERRSPVEEDPDNDREAARTLADMQSSIPPDEQRQLDAEGRTRQRRAQQEIGNTSDNNEQQSGASEDGEEERKPCI